MSEVKLLSHVQVEKGKGSDFIRKLIRLICEFICPKGYTCRELQKLIYTYINALRDCYKFEPKVLDWRQFMELHRKYFGENVYAILYDGKYHVPRKDALIQFIRDNWLDKRRWLEDVYDCDNFALSFKAYLAEIGLINACGFAVGEVRDAKTNQLLGYHAFNVLSFYDETGEVKLVMFEPQTDEIAEIKDGKAIFRDKYIYIPYWVEY